MATMPKLDPAAVAEVADRLRTNITRAVKVSDGVLRDLLADLTPTPTSGARRGPGRPCVLPALCLWAGVVVCLLHGGTAYAEVWRLLTVTGLWDFPRFAVTDQAVYKRLGQDDGSLLRRLFASLSGVLAARLERAGVLVAAKRARQINSYYHNLGEGTFDEFPPPMVDTRSKNYLTIALEEVAQGKLKYHYR